MDVIKCVRELGKAIQQDERFIRYAKARLENDNNQELQAAIGKFNIIRMDMDRIMSSEEKDENKIKELNEELRRVYGEIMSAPAMVEYNTAKVELDQMMSEINTVITKTLEGEDPETCETAAACTGSCSTCGGCH